MVNAVLLQSVIHRLRNCPTHRLLNAGIALHDLASEGKRDTGEPDIRILPHIDVSPSSPIL